MFTSHKIFPLALSVWRTGVDEEMCGEEACPSHTENTATGTLLTASAAPLGGSLWAQEAQEKNPYS